RAGTRQPGPTRPRRSQAPGRPRGRRGGGGDPRLPLGGSEHGRGRPADEPAPLGPDTLPEVPCAGPDVREEDDRLDDRASAPYPRDDADGRQARPLLRRGKRPELRYGHPDESVSSHQPASIPTKPRRGRTSQTPQPPWPRSRTGTR